MLSNVCIDRTRGRNKDHWVYMRPGNLGNCIKLDPDTLFKDKASLFKNKASLQELLDSEENLSGDDLVFVFQLPLPRDGHELVMTPLHQSMVSVATMHIGYHDGVPPAGKFLCC